MKIVLNFAVVLLLIFNTLESFGQSRQLSQTINSAKIQGYYIEIGYQSLQTKQFWDETMNSISRPRKKRNFYELENLKLDNVYYPEIAAYSRYIERDSVVGFWFGINPGGEQEEDKIDQINQGLKSFVDGLPDKYFQFAMNQKIEEAERAYAFTEKSIDKLHQTNSGLNEELNYKREELERYKALVERTQLEVYSLEQTIENNNQQVLEYETDLERMKKLIEDYKNRVN